MLPMRNVPVLQVFLFILLGSTFIIILTNVVNKMTNNIPNSNNTKSYATRLGARGLRPSQLKTYNPFLIVKENLSFDDIPESNLDQGPVIEKSKTGVVIIATVHDLFQPGSKTTVAVKQLRRSQSAVNQTKYEIRMMKMIGKHKNIINFLGYCTQDISLLIVLEYASHGNLKDFLDVNRFNYEKSNPWIGMSLENKLLSFAYQVAQGLKFITSRGFIHRDLSSRNIFVCENYTIKIGDFSEARYVKDRDYNMIKLDPLTPRFWAPPESVLYQIYDQKSEIWAYGVLLWEIMSSGNGPDKNVPYSELLPLLQNGDRLQKPEHCSMELYNVMLECWNFEPKLRPTISEIIEKLDRILNRRI